MYRSSIHARRGLTKSRCRGDAVATTAASEGYRAARLKAVVRAAKVKAWEELLLTIDEDPWGRPYRIVTKKFRP